MDSYSVPIGLKPMWKCGNSLQTGTQVEWGDIKNRQAKWAKHGPGEKKSKEPVNFVLMLLIHDTRFWYHDLIGQITDLWQVTCSSKYTQVHANVFDANTFQKRKHVIIWQVKLPYWHVLQDNCKLLSDGWHQNKVYRLPCLFSFPGHTFSPHFACRYSFLPGSIWEPVCRLCGNLKVGEVSCVKSVDCIFVVDILLITVTIYFNFLQAK